jgi:hypothetical protein
MPVRFRSRSAPDWSGNFSVRKGAGASALLSDAAVNEQVKNLRREMDSPEFKNRYAGFMRSYQEGSTVQNARTVLQEFNNLMMDIGDKALPPVNKMLGGFKGLLESIRSVLPAGKGVGTTVATRAGEGALIGTGVGALFGGVGAIPGAAIGGILGTAEGFMETYGGKSGMGIDKGGSYTSPGKTGHAAQPKAQLAPITLNLNLDGRTLGTAMSEIMVDLYKFSTQAPAGDGVSLYNGGGE